MPAEGATTLGGPGTRKNGVVPVLTPICVADDREVESLLAAAAAELASLRLRHRAATHRAVEAEALAAAASPPPGMTLEEEAAELRRSLHQEWVEHLRLLDAGLDRVRAEATEAIDAARADAVEVLRAASSDLDVAAATYINFPTTRAAGPVQVVAPARADAVAPPVAPPPPPPPPLPAERPALSVLKRLLDREVGLSVIEVAILLLLIYALVR